MNKPKWLEEIEHRADSVPFGEMNISVTRHRSKTSKVTFLKDSKLRPKDNVEAFKDLEMFINSLIEAGFDGKVRFALDFKKGTIRDIAIKNKEIKNYG